MIVKLGGVSGRNVCLAVELCARIDFAAQQELRPPEFCPSGFCPSGFYRVGIVVQGFTRTSFMIRPETFQSWT